MFGGSEANLRLGLETLLGVLNASSRQGLRGTDALYLNLMVLGAKLSHPPRRVNGPGESH